MGVSALRRTAEPRPQAKALVRRNTGPLHGRRVADRPLWADRGKHGRSNKKIGKRGKDLIIKVPIGTIVKDADENIVLRDLASSGERLVVAKGGSGGIGNARKRTATTGEIGEEKNLILELKLVADVGIIGFPNAGKSTLVSCVSRVHTKIAAYPFTTKDPKLGVVATRMVPGV